MHLATRPKTPLPKLPRKSYPLTELHALPTATDHLPNQSDTYVDRAGEQHYPFAQLPNRCTTDNADNTRVGHFLAAQDSVTLVTRSGMGCA